MHAIQRLVSARSIFFLWRLLFTDRNFVIWFLKRINEVKTTTKCSCHSLCNWIVLRAFSCADIHNIDVWNTGISRPECVCVFMMTWIGQKMKSRFEIVRCKCGSCQRLNQIVELEWVCCAEIDCVVAKNNEAVRCWDRTAITRHPGFHAVCLNHSDWMITRKLIMMMVSFHWVEKPNLPLAVRLLRRVYSNGFPCIPSLGSDEIAQAKNYYNFLNVFSLL